MKLAIGVVVFNVEEDYRHYLWFDSDYKDWKLVTISPHKNKDIEPSEWLINNSLILGKLG